MSIWMISPWQNHILGPSVVLNATKDVERDEPLAVFPTAQPSEGRLADNAFTRHLIQDLMMRLWY